MPKLFKKELKKFYKFKFVYCKCGEKISLSSPNKDRSGVRHGHCKPCNLEWHLTLLGKIYSHPIR